jgi:hypothetical protein
MGDTDPAAIGEFPQDPVAVKVDDLLLVGLPPMNVDDRRAAVEQTVDRGNMIVRVRTECPVSEDRQPSLGAGDALLLILLGAADFLSRLGEQFGQRDFDMRGDALDLSDAFIAHFVGERPQRFPVQGVGSLRERRDCRQLIRHGRRDQIAEHRWLPQARLSAGRNIKREQALTDDMASPSTTRAR